MPQMAPMWWTTIMMITLMLILMTIILSYFTYIKKIYSFKKIKSNYLNWKW